MKASIVSSGFRSTRRTTIEKDAGPSRRKEPCSRLHRSFLMLAWLAVVLAGGLPLGARAQVRYAARPNIVIILADDLGYGDLGSYGAARIETPILDRLAAEGMRFTDAHAPAGVCIPSRYGLLTGRYPFRNDNHPNQGPAIEQDRMTIASLLKDQGYATGLVGKWHLGFEGGADFDYTRPLRGGPVDRGFDSFFGIHASTDIPPYFYIRDDRVVAASVLPLSSGRPKAGQRGSSTIWPRTRASKRTFGNRSPRWSPASRPSSTNASPPDARGPDRLLNDAHASRGRPNVRTGAG